MADNYEQATVTPYFPAEIVKKYEEELGNLNVNSTDDGYIYVEDGCQDWDEFIALLQKMLKEAEMDYCYVEGASTCSKMRQGEFGGFAQFITQDDCIFLNTGSWLTRREAEFNAQKKTLSFIPVHEAMQIVYSMAEQNCLDERSNDDALQVEAARQQEALKVVHDFMVNHFAEEEQS